VKIDIPGPGDPEAKGYDWVEVVMVDNRCCNDELERYLISCRPSEPPGRIEMEMLLISIPVSLLPLSLFPEVRII
jgi:hypothetical protein